MRGRALWDSVGVFLGTCVFGAVFAVTSGLDELTCPLGYVKCHDGKTCVATRYWCDGDVDCPGDEEDEAPDCGMSLSCLPTGMSTSPSPVLYVTLLNPLSRCVYWIFFPLVPLVRDDDFPNKIPKVRQKKSDEDTVEPNCPEHFRLCNDSVSCIPLQHWCNHVPDCPNKDDESPDCGEKSFW